MAKFLSQVYSTIRGSVGGVTYTANQFQALIARARVSPVNPNTTLQSGIRSAFSGAQTLYAALSLTQRQAWDDYASSLVFTGPTGTYTVPGRQVCIGNVATALYLKAQGLSLGTPDATPPTILGFLDIDDVSVGTFGTAMETGIAVDATYSGTEDIVIYAKRSQAFEQTRNNFKGPFRAYTLAGTSLTPPSTANLPFNGLTVDLAYFTETRAITENPPHRLSAKFYLRHTAVTNP